MRIRPVWLLALLPLSAAAQTGTLSFARDVVPVFTLAGCAGSACHGSIRGQAGFKLSLFGYEPELDYEAITGRDVAGKPVAGGDGHRLHLTEPEKSLILQKPTMQVAHGGGFRFAVDSPSYRTILEWLKQNAPFDVPGSPRIASLAVAPDEHLLVGTGASVELRATASFTDGSVRDVTGLVQYSSNNPDVAQVSAGGGVKAIQPGETAVMVRMLGKAVAARLAVITSRPGPNYRAVPRHNYIDEFIFSKLRKMNIVPSALAADSEFLRRVYLDTVGLLPTEMEAVEFLASNDPLKRARVIDGLLQRPEFAEFWALKFTELFRAGTREAGAKGGRLIYEYVKRSFRENKPYDRMVTELVLSQGPHLFGKEPSSFYNVTFDSNPADHATNISQIFLGLRIECAKCHNHPWEKWTQDDFHGFAAFFARVGIKEVYENDENAHYYMEEGEVVHPKTRRVVAPKYLDGPSEPDDPEKDIREDLTRWMTSPRNPFFSKAIVNRVWRHYMGRGLVEDVDDFRVTNPPSNPALLDAMAASLSSNGYDLRRLIRDILNSRAYQLSAEPNESNRRDDLNYSRYRMRRLIAEQIVDAISQVTGVAERFRGFPPETRAMQVYVGSPSYMLTAFGRLNRDIICERDNRPDLAQTMHLIGGDTIHKKVHSRQSALSRWVKDSALSDDRIVDRIFLSSLTRYPDEAERAEVRKRLAGRERIEVFQDLMWAILNSKEFQYNH